MIIGSIIEVTSLKVFVVHVHCTHPENQHAEGCEVLHPNGRFLLLFKFWVVLYSGYRKQISKQTDTRSPLRF